MAQHQPKAPKRIVLTPEQLAEPITRANFWLRARHFIDHTLGKPDALPTIRMGTEAWAVWRQYFERHLGFLPVAMRLALEAKPDAYGNARVVTVPTEFPQVFDPTFAEDPGWRPAAQRSQAFVPRETYAQLTGRYGLNWGLTVVGGGARRKPRAPTIEELRAHYGVREETPA